jgi:predicted kinase
VSAGLLVLLGPPGSGKSHLASLASARAGLPWTEHEKLFVDRWGSVEAFVAAKAEALAWVEAHLREQMAASERPVLFESTGLSDRTMLERFAASGRVTVAKLVVPRDLCVERVRSRPKGRHLSDDAEAAGRFHDFWTQSVAPGWHADAVVANDVRPEDPDAAARTEALVRVITDLAER